jgi:hypothetical protein
VLQGIDRSRDWDEAVERMGVVIGRRKKEGCWFLGTEGPDLPRVGALKRRGRLGLEAVFSGISRVEARNRGLWGASVISVKIY